MKAENTPVPLAKLLPGITTVNDKAHLSIGGCDVVDLAAEFGTPLYVYDESTLRKACRDFIGTFRGMYEDSTISYSSKAFTSPTLLRILAEEEIHIDVVSGGELELAKIAGFPPEKINFHGNNKSLTELESALDYAIKSVTVDSFWEIALLDKATRNSDCRQNVLIRVSPSVNPHTHHLTTTGILDSKFGFPITTGAAEQAVEQIMEAPGMELVGIHFHLGSPIFKMEPYKEAIRYALDFACDMKKRFGFDLEEFNPGGGFAIGYSENEVVPPIEDYARTITNAVVEECERLELKLPSLVVEPGRAIVGRAGVAVYTVGAIKEIPGVRTYVSVDGGMGDNIRPALYDAVYEVVSGNKPLAPHDFRATIAGKYCESGDFLVKDARIPTPEAGDLLVLPSAGAYCLAMSSNYNMNLRPAAVLVNEGEVSMLRKRDAYADLLAPFAV